VFYSNPSKSKHFGQYSPPVPSDLLEQLAAMKVSTAKEASAQQQQAQLLSRPAHSHEYNTKFKYE
jgi:hypothetical protein